jgi:hypothetical protein
MIEVTRSTRNLTWRVALVSAVLTASLAACSSGAGAADPTDVADQVASPTAAVMPSEPRGSEPSNPPESKAPPSSESDEAVPPLPDVPVDASLTPVSASNPSSDAKSALDRCSRPGARVAGMAHLKSAREVQKYTRTNGNEPELRIDMPVWVVQLEGLVNYRSGPAFNPLCVVREDGMRLIYLPYGSPGHPPMPDFPGPEAALPPLAP